MVQQLKNWKITLQAAPRSIWTGCPWFPSNADTSPEPMPVYRGRFACLVVKITGAGPAGASYGPTEAPDVFTLNNGPFPGSGGDGWALELGVPVMISGAPGTVVDVAGLLLD